MKTIFLIRHAKSSWEDPMLRDIDRPLNHRGLRDAPFMAEFLSNRVSRLDAILSSPANRAFTTATYFATAFGMEERTIIANEDIYEALPKTIYRIINTFPEKWSVALLFGHNPTLTMLANDFSAKHITNVPTCGIVKIEASIDRWDDFNNRNGQLTDFYYPKQFDELRKKK